MDNLSAALAAPRSLPKVFHGVKEGVYTLIQTLPQFEEFLFKALSQRMIVVDTETSGLDWVRDHVCGIVIGFGTGDNYYLPINHKTFEKQLSIDVILPGLQNLFSDPNRLIITWHGKFDLHGLYNLGIEVAGKVHDGLNIAHLHDENEPHGLKEMSIKYIDKNAAKWEHAVKEFRKEESKRRRHEFGLLVKSKVADLLEDGVLKEIEETKKRLKALKAMAVESLKDHILAKNKLDDISYDYVPLDILAPYACADTHYTWVMFKDLFPKVWADSYLKKLYQNELELLRVLFETERRGLKVDIEYIKKIIPNLQTDIDSCAERVFSRVGNEFDIDSPKQLVAALQTCGIQLTKLTKRSEKLQSDPENDEPPTYAVDKKVLEGLAVTHEFAQAVMSYREASKLKATYADAILRLCDKENFLHTSFNQNVSTGRMSASGGVNFMNFPAKNKTIKRAFITPSDDHFLVYMDLSQIELRLTAHVSQDPKMLACYPKQGIGTDIHDVTCAEVVMNTDIQTLKSMKTDKTGHIDAVNIICPCNACTYEEMRKTAKRVNFGIIYRVGPKGLKQQISTPQRPVEERVCAQYIDRYLANYRGVKNWINLVDDYILAHGFIIHEFGRYRRFPDIKNRNLARWKKDRMLRQGTNFLIQGLAADLFKVAIVRINKFLKNYKTKLVNFVHDEIQFYWHKDEYELIPKVKSLLEDFNFTVPIVADVSYSTTNWADKKPLK